MKMHRTVLAFAVSALFAATAMAADLPGVKILATGGTIAGAAASSTATSGYKAGEIGIQTLIDAVPQMKDIANVSGEQVVNIDSSSMRDDIILKLAKRCNELLKDPKVSGIVITHGTDTLEETAYFLNLTVHSKKPVVLVGAMRPATAISADGPLNLLDAVRLAVSKDAVGQGVMVAMNNAIDGARDVTKTSTTNVATFKAPELGALGYINNGQVQFFKKSIRKHTVDTPFDVTKIKSLPRVDIVYSHINDDGTLAKAAVAAGAKGIVHAGSGDGSVHGNTKPALIEASHNGVVVVRSTRVHNGFVQDDAALSKEGIVYSGTLNPQKSRILLQLALTQTQDPKKIQEYFNLY